MLHSSGSNSWAEKFFIVLLFFVLVFRVHAQLPAIASAQVKNEKQVKLCLEQYNVRWDTPSVDASGSMPLGNGDIALNAWVEKSGDLLFYIAKSDAWSGDLVAPNYGAYGLIKVGLVRVSLTPNPFVPTDGFLQMLRLKDGTFEVNAGSRHKKSTLILWVDANRPVIHVDTKCSSSTRMKVSMESWRKKSTEYLGADSIVSGYADRVIWYYRGLNKEIPYLIDRTIGAAILGDGLVKENEVTLESVKPSLLHHVSIHPLTAQCPSQAQWLTKLNRQIDSTLRTPIGKARRDHEEWWINFWNRSYIFINSGENAQEVTRGYLLQRFKNACTGRGESPIKFNGSLFTVENTEPVIIRDRNKVNPDKVVPVTADYRAWGYRYWFQNTRPIYWPMMASGDFDLMQPFFRMYSFIVKDNARQVKQMYGHDGSYITEGEAFWGDNMPNVTSDTPGYYGTHYYTPILELSSMMLDYYAYTLNDKFARETMMPVADAGVKFFDQHFPRDKKGKLLLDPDNAIETFWKVRNPLPDIAGLRFVLKGLLALPEGLTDSASRRRWNRFLAEVPPVPSGIRNGKMLLLPYEDGQNAVARNIENPELYAIYPFRIYGLGKPDIEVAQNAFAVRKNRRAACWSQEAVQSALLGDAETARTFVTGHLTRKDPRMRFPAFWDKGSDYVPDEDNGGNGLHALQSMLLQFDGSKILLLPAWPKSWDADFKLHAPFNTILEGCVRQGKVIHLKVTPAIREKDIIFMGNL